MALSVALQVEDTFAVLKLEGNLTLGPDLSKLREAAKQALDKNKLAGIILDTGLVTTTDSAGLGELTVVYTLASRRGCPIMLAGVGTGLRSILEMTRLDALLPSAHDISDAKKQLAGL